MRAGIVIIGAGVLAIALWMTLKPGQSTDHLLVTQVVASPLEEGGAAAFLRIENRGDPDRLIGVESPVAEAKLYSPQHPDGPPVPAGNSALAADGAHIRLGAPTKPLADGALIPVKLTFAEAGTVQVKARLADPKTQGAAAGFGLFGLGDICLVGDGEPAPRLTLSVEPEGDGWRVDIDAEEFTFSDEFVDLYHIPGMGHGHVYVGGMKIGRLYEPTAYIGALPKGQHEVRVTLNTNDHRAYVVDDVPVTAAATIAVD